MSPEMLRELRHKYREMLEMRLAHAAGPQAEGDVRPRMAALAVRFPGALREIDDLELDEIRARILSLDASVDEGRDPEPWMEAVALFHTLTRGALCAKRWLHRRRVVDDAVTRAFLADLSTMPFPEDAAEWRHELGSLAAPPRGRVLHLVFQRVASRLRISEDEARLRVFGVPRRRASRQPGRSSP
jgi:hypothetical protein